MANVVAEPCFPVIVAHGHLAELIDAGVDWLFVPNTVSAETAWLDNESYLCPWNQTLPFVLRQAPGFERHSDNILCPCVEFRLGRQFVTRAMARFCRRLSLSGQKVETAMAAAYQVQHDFRTKLAAAGQRALEQLSAGGQSGIVIIGRPYNVHDAGVNLNVARKLRDYYGVNCIPIDAIDVAGLDIRDINDNMFWDYGRRMLAAARVVGRQENLHIIHITNFKCGPDSFVKHFLRRASGGKPLLSLQFDGHSNDAGMMTRCEAYLDSKGILRPWKKPAVQEAVAAK
jgi:predicted nucleotide-binding protein (sugar kinase/HSP70/actin superfamily)